MGQRSSVDLAKALTVRPCSTAVSDSRASTLAIARVFCASVIEQTEKECGAHMYRVQCGVWFGVCSGVLRVGVSCGVSV